MAARILIVDDDVDTLKMVGMMLERQGYEILAATGGVQGLAMAIAEKPTLVLLDVMMPDMDGIEVARKLRADPNCANIIIILFTAKTQVEDKLSGFEAGIDDYITKPIQPKELVARVNAVLNRALRSAEGLTSLQRVSGERGKLIGVIGAKGGIGVTTLTVNLGLALITRHHKTVTIADYRPGAGTLGLEIGLPSIPGSNQLLHMQADEISLQKVELALVTGPSNARFLLASPDPRDALFLTYIDHFEVITNHLLYLSPVTILDLGVSVTPINEKLLPRCNIIVIVVEPVTQTILQTRYLIDFLHSINFTDDQIITVLYNRVRAGVQLSLSQVQDQLRRRIDSIFTAIPDLAYQAQVDHTPILLLKQTDGVTLQQISQLADKIALQV